MTLALLASNSCSSSNQKKTQQNEQEGAFNKSQTNDILLKNLLQIQWILGMKPHIGK
jgi:hypothetical protein